jgi:hypothetical protein
LQQDERRIIWFGSDLCGEPLPFTEKLRDEVAGSLGVERDQIIWSTSQSHSTGAIPGSVMAGSHIMPKVAADPTFLEAEKKRLMTSFIEAAREATDRLQPARIWAGRGFCDSIGYNSRFPMPTGGSKFSRNYMEGLQSGKYFDSTIGLVRFEDRKGNPIGVVFNFCCHPAVLVMTKYCSPDWVGSARQYIEDATGGTPAMFIQGFCGDVHPRHMFGTPKQAAMLGQRLGEAAVEALPTLIPARAEPFAYLWKPFEIRCRPMWSHRECEEQIVLRRSFTDEVTQRDPRATWVSGYNFPGDGLFTPEQRAQALQLSINYFEEAIRMIDAGEPARETLGITLGALRIGDVGAALSPGENFTTTGLQVRSRSPFVHTLVCGDTNGLFGYIGTDDEIDRGGAETYFSWNHMIRDGFRLPPAKGNAQRIVNTFEELLRRLHKET